MLSVPLFTAEALLRNHGMLLLVKTADIISRDSRHGLISVPDIVPLFTAMSCLTDIVEIMVCCYREFIYCREKSGMLLTWSVPLFTAEAFIGMYGLT